MTTTETRRAGTRGRRHRADTAEPLARALSPAKIGGVYVLLLMIVVFSIWVPETFPEADTARQILNNNAIGAMAALTLVVPLSAGVFDISVPNTMTLSGVLSTYAIVNSDQSVVVGVLIGVGVSVLVGVLNGVVVVVAKIDSLIGTLATGFLIQSLVQWRTGSRIISGPELAGSFQDIARTTWLFDLTLPVYYAMVVALVLWYVLEHTATGRRIYATGFNLEATRLASVRTERMRFGVPDGVLDAGRDHRDRARVHARFWFADGRELRTCCRRSPPCSSARLSSRVAASTPGARSSQSSSSAR